MQTIDQASTEIKLFIQGYEKIKNQPIYVDLENEKNNLQPEKEQIMKYQGKTIHKNKNAETWYTRVRIDGKQVYISAKTQKDCYNKLKQAVKHANLGILSTPAREKAKKGITLLEWYEKWLELYKLGKMKATTLRGYSSLIKHIPNNILNKELKEIKLLELIETINNCKAERQRQNLYELLNMLYKKAIDNDYVEKNLIERIEKPKHEKDHGQALTNKQQELLINKCKTITNGDLILVAMFQGLRRGEVLGLTIDNLNFENNTITINKAWNSKNKFDTTKNSHSKRTLPMFEETKTILLKYKNQKERIFEISNKQCDNLIEKIKELTQIANLKLKDMRSTFITRCKELNIPKHIIQSWVGHKIGSSVTDIVYTKHNTDVDNNYINIINKSKFYSNSTHEPN